MVVNTKTKVIGGLGIVTIAVVTSLLVIKKSVVEVPVAVSGQVGPQYAQPVLYNGRYAILQSTFGFFWLNTERLEAGHVQAISVCQPLLPPSNSGYVLAGGDCNAISDVATLGDQVVAKMWSGQCGAQRLGCGGPRDDGHFLLAFRLGTWEFLGDGADIANSTQGSDPQGVRWSLAATDTTYRNFVWRVEGTVTPGPTPSLTSVPPSPVPPTGVPTSPIPPTVRPCRDFDHPCGVPGPLGRCYNCAGIPICLEIDGACLPYPTRTPTSFAFTPFATPPPLYTPVPTVEPADARPERPHRPIVVPFRPPGPG